MFTISFISLWGCHAGNALLEDKLVGQEGNGEGTEPIVYTLTLEEPMYGEFYQEGPIPVIGKVDPYVEKVLVEDIEVLVEEDGTFSTSVPFAKQYAIVDVEVPDTDLRERIPVFWGSPPLETWPGGMAGRLLPAGMSKLGEQIGAQIDATGWLDNIQLPTVDNGTWGLNPIGVLHDPTVVLLSPARSGVALDFLLANIGFSYEIWWDIPNVGAGSSTVTIQIEEIGIGTTADPILQDDGTLVFSLYDADLTMENPQFIFDGNHASGLEWLLQQGSQWILEPIGENLVDQLLSQLGEIPVGGPFAFETNVMGTDIGLQLDELYGDLDGLALELELAIGESLETNASYVPIPMIEDAADGAQLALVMHDAILDVLVREQVLGLLNQDLDLSGFAGTFIGNIVSTLDGGDQIPSNVQGWCLTLDPGPIGVVRLQEGIDPLAYLYLPDMTVTIGTDMGSGCSDWLVLSLAGEVGITITDGSKLGFDFSVGEGAVLYYRASGYDEDAVVQGFGRSLSSLVGLLGGVASIDLSTIFGGGNTGVAGLSGLSIAILDSQKIYDFYDEWPEGLFSISMNLFE